MEHFPKSILQLRQKSNISEMKDRSKIKKISMNCTKTLESPSSIKKFHRNIVDTDFLDVSSESLEKTFDTSCFQIRILISTAAVTEESFTGSNS